MYVARQVCQIEKYVEQEKLMYPCGNAEQNQFNDSCKVCRDGQYLSHCLISFISPPFTVTSHIKLIQFLVLAKTEFLFYQPHFISSTVEQQ